MKIENAEMIINFGALGYDTKKMSSILGVAESEIAKELKSEDSEFSKLIEKGKTISEYVIDLKIFNLAKQGDLAAIAEFKKRKEQRLKIAKSKKHFSK